jgi:5-methylcytosine-specific restriction endonuclease McrA
MYVRQRKNEYIDWDAERCHYCGVLASDVGGVQLDHFIPRRLGGSEARSNLVVACKGCNQAKASRSFAEARLTLVLRRLGWPRFTAEQLDWLKNQGFDTTPVEQAKLYFEE